MRLLSWLINPGQCWCCLLPKPIHSPPLIRAGNLSQGLRGAEGLVGVDKKPINDRWPARAPGEGPFTTAVFIQLKRIHGSISVFRQLLSIYGSKIETFFVANPSYFQENIDNRELSVLKKFTTLSSVCSPKLIVYNDRQRHDGWG